MRIAMASDHAGHALKEEIKALLEAGGHEVVDFGTDTEKPATCPTMSTRPRWPSPGARPTAGSSSTVSATAAR